MPSTELDNPSPPGSRLRPGWHLRLYQLIKLVTRLEGGPGVTVTPLPGGGHSLAAHGVFANAILARVVAAPAFAPTDPAACTYTVQAFGRDGVRLVGVLPVLGRPTAQGEFKLWPAKVGDRCFLLRAPGETGVVSDQLWVLSEAIAGKACP